MPTTQPKIVPLVKSVVTRFRERYRTTWDDIEQDAHLAALRAVECHDEGRGTLSTWVTFKVTHALKNCVRKRASIARREACREGLHKAPARRDGPHSLEAITHEMSEDAARLCLLVVVQPLSLALILARNGVRATPNSIRKAIKIYCHEIGWKKSRALRAFAEIREHLENLQ